MCMHCIHIMEGSFAGPRGNLPFQPWKMRNRLGNLTQCIDWMAITCIVGICLSLAENKMLKLENCSWILAVSHWKISKQANLQTKIYTFWNPSGCAWKGKPSRLGEGSRPRWCSPGSLEASRGDRRWLGLMKEGLWTTLECLKLPLLGLSFKPL